MANVGTAPTGKVLIGQGVTNGPKYASIGTSSGLTPHGIVIGQGAGAFTATGTGTTGQLLQSQGALADPTYTTATYPSAAGSVGTILRSDGTNWVATVATYPNTTILNQLLFSSSNNVIGGLSTPNQAVLTSSLTGIPTWVPIATNGQIIIGSTAGSPAAATLTAGAGISITNGSNSITISSSGGGFTWTDVTGATQTIAIANGYLTDRGGGVTYTLPASASIGDTFVIVGKAGLATITPNANQQLLIGSATGTVGVTGTAVSNNAGDCITFVCTTSGASTIWRASSVVGTWTLN